ncbi:S8 family serine peptidase [Schaalia sp. 19OD2882]|uniref:S8 family serine peptidase n=1 Tax=Schaalia sp. 19OD2882 TaxID=2794089 RepID=UPI001C1ED1C7|nr:S8 family serine peptidase [Schaalia sp. 19OD2882]QWW19825.1 S8 family serine peptidase [Schaalia sp. 19OD2882]
MTRAFPALAAVLTATALSAAALQAPARSAMLPAAEGTRECTPGLAQYVAQPPDAFAQMGIEAAWEFSDGEVVVAVVDSGVAASNAHLGSAVLPGLDLVERGDGRTDVFGHGTAIAGQIAARPVSGSGLVGVAPKSKILPVRTYVDMQDQSMKAGKGPDPRRTAEGIKWAAEQGAKVIVVAQSTTQDTPALRDAVRLATAHGALVVASAGNASENDDGASIRFPAGYPEALSVTAVGRDGLPSQAVVHGLHVEVAAPGQAVLTTFLDSGDCVLAGEQASTSYATGYAAGVAALVAAAHPQEAPADWEYRMLATALRSSRSQREKNLGWGLLAPREAINFVNDGRLQGPHNPRFPAPAKQVAPLLPQPVPQDPPPVDPFLVVAGMAGCSAALTLAGVLASRLIRCGRTRSAQDG